MGQPIRCKGSGEEGVERRMSWGELRVGACQGSWRITLFVGRLPEQAASRARRPRSGDESRFRMEPGLFRPAALEGLKTGLVHEPRGKQLLGAGDVAGCPAAPRPSRLKRSM